SDLPWLDARVIDGINISFFIYSGFFVPHGGKEGLMTVRFGLLGAGRIGKVHARAIGSNQAARLVAVADAAEQAARDISDAYGAEMRTIDQIEQASDIDAVVICTPTDTHRSEEHTS